MSLKKKIFTGIGSVFLVVAGYIGYTQLTSDSLSPADVVIFQQQGLSFQLDYCKPSKKDRLIFGTMEDSALIPFGKYWRLGANDATKLTLETKMNFGGQLLSKGSYSLYAFPDEAYWVIGINAKSERSGATPPDFSQDVGRIKVPVIKTSEEIEQFSITVEESGSEVFMIMQWDRVQVQVPLNVAN